MVTGGDWCQAITLYQHLTGLGFQWWHDDRSGVPTAVSLWNPFGVICVPVILSCAMLHGVGAVVAGGIGVGGIMHSDTADDVLPLLGQGAGGCMLLLLLFIGVAADSDDAHGGAGGVGNDYGLPLPLPRGAGGHVTPAAGDGSAAGRAVVHHGTARRRVFLHSFRPLRRADGLRGRNFVGGCISRRRLVLLTLPGGGGGGGRLAHDVSNTHIDGLGCGESHMAS